MVYDDFKNFPPTGKLLCLDWGEKRIGVAVSCPNRLLCFARPHIGASGSMDKILKLVADECASGIVIGLPLKLDGTDSKTTKRVRNFASDLATRMNTPIVLFDETLTSFEAAERGAPPNDLDSESARILLENAIAVMNR